MSPEDALAWRPGLPGWSTDILAWYSRIAPELPRPARCAEIGVAWGRSVLFLAERLLALPGQQAAIVWAIDDWSIEWRIRPESGTAPGAARVAGRHPLEVLTSMAKPGELEIVCPLKLRSREAARLFEPASLDLIFVDAEHDADTAVDDVLVWAPRVARGGWLAGHDFDRRSFPGVVRAVEAFADFTKGSGLGFGHLQVEGTVWSFRRE